MSVNFFLRSLVVALLVTASASAAVTTVWNGTASNDWTNVANWTSTVPALGDTVNINAVTAYPVLSTPAVPSAGYIAAMNLNAGGTKLTIASGGQLYTSGLYMGATDSVGSILNVDSGGELRVSSSNSYYWNAGEVNIRGTLYVNRTLYAGHGSTAAFGRTTTINVVDGGAFSTGNQCTLILGNTSATGSVGNTGILNIWGDNGAGTSSLVSFGTSTSPITIGRTGNKSGVGLVDLRRGGRLEFATGAQDTAVQNGINAGTVVAGDPRKLLVKAFIPGSTTRYRLTTFVNDWAYQPVPAHTTNDVDTMTLVPLGSVPVSWKAPIARDNSDTIECKVYANFDTGTYDIDMNGLPMDPNGDDLPLYTTITRPAVTSLTMTSIIGGRYQWRVDCVDNSVDPLVDPNYPITTKGPVWYFRTGNQAPVANAGTTQTLGLVGGAATFASNASITDDGLPIGGDVTGQWTQLDGPTTVAGLPANVTAASPNVNLSLTQAGRYRFQLIPYDTLLYGTASIVQANVYSDSCLAAKAGTWTAMQGDFNADCKVSAADLSLMVADWLRCTDTISGCN